MSSKALWFAAAVCMFAAAFAIYAPVVPDHPYAYDEADYMWAGKQGFLANYTDRNALSIVEFVEKGLELSKDSSKREAYSEYIRASGDLGLFRHYHGPMYAYWLAAMQAAGLKREDWFRASGLLIHFASATIILFGFWFVFPSLPRLAGFIACALFVFNRTALTAATAITQHVVFTFFCVAMLFAASRFFRDFETRWFYVTAAILGASFCAVETSALLAAALLLAMAVEFRPLRDRYTLPGLAKLIAKGIGVLLLAILVCWPAGLVNFGILKGFLTLAYISIYRKTFSPFGTLDLWSARFQSSPWEFSLLIAGAIAAFVFWRRFEYKRELLPWLSFIAVFFVIMLKVTVPYVYYYAPLTAAFTVATGVVCGILWRRWAAPWRVVVPLAALASIVGTTVQYREVAREYRATRPCSFAVLRLLDRHPVAEGERLFLPYQLVPTVHYYHPEIVTTGFDTDYPLARLADEVVAPTAADILLCEEKFCAALNRLSPHLTANKTLLDPSGPNGQPFYVVDVLKTRGL